MKSTQNKLAKVMAEVDSLKAVLEMKTEEIHSLRLEKAKLEDKLEDFDRMKVAKGKVSAQMEDLKAQLNEKQVLERKLSEENRQLCNSMEREMNAKRRLTMEKEELQWRMRTFQPGDAGSNPGGPMSMSMMEGPCYEFGIKSLLSYRSRHYYESKVLQNTEVAWFSTLHRSLKINFCDKNCLTRLLTPSKLE